MNGKNSLKVTLQEDTEVLDEVVVAVSYTHLSQTTVATGRMDQSERIVEVCRNGSEHVPEECFF